MRLQDVRDGINYIPSTPVRVVLEKLVDVLEEVGVDYLLEEKEFKSEVLRVSQLRQLHLRVCSPVSALFQHRGQSR